MLKRLVIGMGVLVLALDLRAQDAEPVSTLPKGVSKIRIDASALAEVTHTEIGRAFLEAADVLPEIGLRVVYRDGEKGAIYSEEAAARLSASDRRKLIEVPVDEEFYYSTRYGTPLAYVRVMELYGGIRDGSLAGRKVLDFGYGKIGHLRLMAQCGADVVGVEVDPLLEAIYREPGDQGVIPSETGTDGRIKLVLGRYPDIAAEVGGGYDLITSKNTLKNGFFRPRQQVPIEQMVNLGVRVDKFIKIVADALKPGGVFIIYNICPAPSKPGQPYKNWADGRSPFSREMMEAAGLEVLDFDTNDDQLTRDMGRALRWATGDHAGELDTNLFAWYTIAVKK